jgi:hypothetical protein
MSSNTSVIISGIIGGKIWMPACTCAKSFKASNQKYPFTHYSDGSQPTLRDMVLHITNDGDFQDASIADAEVTFSRTKTLSNGERVTRTRTMDVRKFPSVADCILEFESNEYFAVIDAQYGSEE